MSSAVNFTVRMDADIKHKAEAIYGEWGINLTTAINAFLRQSVRVGGFPFDMRLDEPNRDTIMAILEAEALATNPDVVKFDDVEAALEELKR